MASDLAQLRKDLIKHFGSVLEENEELLNECTHVLSIYLEPTSEPPDP
jgi:hypothetical protein